MMKRLLFKLTVLVALVLNGIYCVAQPKFSASVGVEAAYMPFRNEDEIGVLGKTKWAWGGSADLYGSAGIDFPNMPFEVYADLYAATPKLFKSKLPCEDDYVLNFYTAIKPGFGIRLYINRKWGVTPILVAGINYDLILYKGFYGWDKDQINKGVNNFYGIGLYGNKSGNGLVFGVEIPNKSSFLNKDYSPDGGYYFPYANLKDDKFPTFLLREFVKF